MRSVILQIAARYIRFLLIVFALLALIRGHNLPGGGFIGGLIAALSVVYSYFAFGREVVMQRMKFRPELMIFLGLTAILVSVIPGIFTYGTIMQGVWFEIPLGFTALKLGTPFLFDIGVFFAVIGVTLFFVFSLLSRS